MIHHVYANRSNIGDWHAARSIHRLLGTSVQELLCDAPYLRTTLARLGSVDPHDVVVVGAGGLLMDYFADFWEGFLRLPVVAPLVLWGVGCCSVKHAPSSLDPALVRRIVDRADVVAVRDELTVDALPDDDRVRLVPCPSLAFDLERPTSSPPALLHATHGYTIGADVLAEVCSQAQTFAEAAGLRYAETDHRIVPDDTAALDRGVAALASAEIIVSSRLHGCLLGFAARRPVIAVSGDAKVDSFMRWAGLEEWLIDATDGTEVVGLGDRLARIDRYPVRNAADAAVDTARRTNLQVADAVRTLHRAAGGSS